MAEFDRASRANNTDPLDRLRVPHELHTLTVTDLPVLDLRHGEALRHVGLAAEDLADPDWTACQAVGHAAWFLHAGGVIASSATGIGLVITVFGIRLKPQQLTVASTITLDAQTYRDAHAS